nr:DPP IV N-terminal domain-containing protein [uncultured Psychroserpens sp.]
MYTTKIGVVLLAVSLFLSCQEKEIPQNTHPMWSPDGTKLAFISNKIGVENNNPINFEVYTMNVDGSSSIIRHTFNKAFESDINWSPDGTKLAVKSFSDKNDEVYVIDLNSKEQTNISNHSNADGSPVWSSNNEYLYFHSERDNENGELYSYNLKTKVIKRLTNNNDNEYSAVWSPDGKNIAYVSNKDGDDDIYIMNILSKKVIQLTNNPLSDWYPQWSPDGKSIIFTYGDWNTDIWEIRIINVDGAAESKLIEQTDSGNASWHPEGTKIAFASSRSGKGEIYIYDLTSKAIKKITK